MARLILQVRRQLGSATGLIGYSLDAHSFAREYWTLSAWEDAVALGHFVADHPHVDVMSALAVDMGKTEFVRWFAPGHELPPRWTDARTRIRS